MTNIVAVLSEKKFEVLEDPESDNLYVPCFLTEPGLIDSIRQT